MAYCTVAEAKNWMMGAGGPQDTWDDTELTVVLDACTRVIDRMTGRSFVVETGATKYFYPTEEGRLSVVDLNTVTSIAVDSSGNQTYATTLATTDYELLPILDELGVPATRFNEIRIWPQSSKSFGPGRRVRIIGNWGWSTVPAAIKTACQILSARIWKRRETPLGILGATDLGQFERLSKDDPDVARLLEPYMLSGSGQSATWVLV